MPTYRDMPPRGVYLFITKYNLPFLLVQKIVSTPNLGVYLFSYNQCNITCFFRLVYVECVELLPVQITCHHFVFFTLQRFHFLQKFTYYLLLYISLIITLTDWLRLEAEINRNLI